MQFLTGEKQGSKTPSTSTIDFVSKSLLISLTMSYNRRKTATIRTFTKWISSIRDLLVD